MVPPAFKLSEPLLESVPALVMLFSAVRLKFKLRERALPKMPQGGMSEMSPLEPTDKLFALTEKVDSEWLSGMR